MKVGYARISKQELNEELQIGAIKEAKCDKWFLDTMTGTFVVWKLDRAGRSLTHLIELLKDLKERGIEFWESGPGSADIC